MGDIIPSEQKSILPNSAIDYLSQVSGHEVDLAMRVAITASCRDADYIPKVVDAGKVFSKNGQQYQLMHNGIKVAVDGYYGSWMTELITKLHGHHEPQEEKVFYELSQYFRPGTTMIELGSYWSFYSLWFNKTVPDARNICCEPDPENRKIGERNFKLNNFNNVTFVDAAAGKDNGKRIEFETGRAGQPLKIQIRSVDSLVEEQQVKQLEVLHIDVQGAEYDALLGASKTIKEKKLRFLFVSTHHFLISRDPNIHQRCLDFIKKNGGHIICDHDIHESYSGDGLIVASFDKQDQKLAIEISHNRMANSQFRPYTEDLELVFRAYDKQLDRLARKSQALAKQEQQLAKLESETAISKQQTASRPKQVVKKAIHKLRMARPRR